MAGGDLNALPPGTAQVRGFADSRCPDDGPFSADDFTGEEGWLERFYAWNEAIALDTYRRDNGPYLSHTTDGRGFWNRRLDYLFTNGRVAPGSGMVHQSAARGGLDTIPLSDHAPVSMEVAL